jgi:hypothetical protein
MPLMARQSTTIATELHRREHMLKPFSIAVAPPAKLDVAANMNFTCLQKCSFTRHFDIRSGTHDTCKAGTEITAIQSHDDGTLMRCRTVRGWVTLRETNGKKYFEIVNKGVSAPTNVKGGSEEYLKMMQQAKRLCGEDSKEYRGLCQQFAKQFGGINSDADDLVVKSRRPRTMTTAFEERARDMQGILDGNSFVTEFSTGAPSTKLQKDAESEDAARSLEPGTEKQSGKRKWSKRMKSIAKVKSWRANTDGGNGPKLSSTVCEQPVTSKGSREPLGTVSNSPCVAHGGSGLPDLKLPRGTLQPAGGENQRPRESSGESTGSESSIFTGCPRPPGAVKRPSRSSAFSIVNRCCMALLYGRAGRLTAKNGGFRPLVPPPVWSTIYLLLQKVTSPRFTILNGSRPPGSPVLLVAIVLDLVPVSADIQRPCARQPGRKGKEDNKRLRGCAGALAGHHRSPRRTDARPDIQCPEMQQRRCVHCQYAECFHCALL